MSLTRTRRIIIAVAGLMIVALLLFPPAKTRGWLSIPPPLEFGGQMWIGDAVYWGIDVISLTVELLIVVAVTSVAFAFTGPKPR